MASTHTPRFLEEARLMRGWIPPALAISSLLCTGGRGEGRQDTQFTSHITHHILTNDTSACPSIRITRDQLLVVH